MTDVTDITSASARRELVKLARRHPQLTTPKTQARLDAWLGKDPVAKDETLSEALYLRVAPSDIARLDTLSERITIASRNAIARAAMRLGLDLLEQDPALIISAPPPKRGRKPKRKGR